MQYPRKVTAKITRTATAIAIVTLDRQGAVEEVVEILEELDTDDCEVQAILSVLSVHY
jgi:hypothetical protein